MQASYVYPNDFCQDYYAARNYIQHRSIYSHVPCLYLNTNAHTPPAIALFLPLVAFDLTTATRVWSVASIIFYLTAGFLLLRELAWLSISSFLLFTLGSLAWPSLMTANYAHNVAQLLLLMLVGAWIFNKRGHGYSAGVILGCATLLKIWPALFLVGSLLTGQKKVAASGLTTILIGFLLTLFLFNPSVYAYYVHYIYGNEQIYLNNPTNISLVGTVMKMFVGFRGLYGSTNPLIRSEPMSVSLFIGYLLTTVAIFMVMVFLYWYDRKSGHREQDLLVYGFLFVVEFLIFPVTWDWNAMMLLLPLALLLKEIFARPRLPVWWYTLCVIGVISLVNPVRVTVTNPTVLISVEQYYDLLLTAGILCFAACQIFLLLRRIPMV